MSWPDTLKVRGNLLDLGLLPGAESLALSLSQAVILYKSEFQIIGDELSVAIDANGDWEVDLVETDNMEDGAHYIFKINQRIYKRLVPAATHDWYFRDLPIFDG